MLKLFKFFRYHISFEQMSNSEWLHNVKKEYSKRRSLFSFDWEYSMSLKKIKFFVPTEASRKAIGIKHLLD